MARMHRRPGPTAFRAAPSVAPAARPTRRQAVALLAVLAIVTGTVVAVSYLVRPDRARSFDLFHGSVFLADSVAPVAVDLASGHPTVRLIDAEAQVGARSSSDLTVTPLSQGTLLLNRVTGEFNIVASTGFVVKTNGGVPITARPGSTQATAVASGELAYVEQTGATGTSVYLVGQTTVETASNVAAKVRPRAFRSMSEPGSTDPGAAAGAGGDLWLLLGSGDRRVVRRLALPPNSSTGATLRSTDHGRVDGPAALASAATSTVLSPMSADSGSTAADVVGIASADRIRVLQGAVTLGAARFPAVAGLDRVLPATDGVGRLSYLFHGSAGWSVASVDARGGDLRGPDRLTGLPADAALTAPAASRGSLYTMDTTSGRLIRIGADNRAEPIAGATTYPLAEQGGRVVEPGGFGDGQVVARGSRVIFNSPTHLNAVVVFTDGSHRPLTIAKSSAVSVSAAGGAESLTRSRVDAGSPRTTTTPAPQPKAENPVNNKIDCKSVRQKPHFPTIVGATPGSRTVALTWTYPLLGPQDCAPSTYQVNVRTLTANAPSAPSTVRVQGQQSVNLAGLFPSTQYELTVSAYLNGQGTESAPRRVTTGPEGPAPPKDVAATTDSSGNWNINWSSCGSAQKGCVPAASWKVVPEFCDGRGLSGAPSPISVTADPTSVGQPPAQLRGGDALLGRGLRFQVEGTGVEGTVGEPSAYTPCTYSWAPPVAARLSLHASTKPLGNLGDTTTATVTLDAGNNAVRTTGGVGAQITYSLLNGASTVKTIGPTTDTSVTFTGITAGQQYTTRATVAPPRHADAAVTVGPIPVPAATAPWPTISAQVASPNNTGAASANVTVAIRGITSAAARAEKFSLVNSRFQCDQAGFDLTNQNIDPAIPITFAVDRTKYYGSCTVTVQLRQSTNLTDPPLFGDGTTSNADTSNTFTVDAPTLIGIAGGDFNASWAGAAGGQSHVHIAYTGGNPLIGLARNWAASLTGPDGSSCGGYSGSDQLADITVTQACVDVDGASGQRWKVTVSFGFLSQPRQTFTVTDVDGGAAPTYRPPVCDVGTAGLSAQWSGSLAAPTIDVNAADPDKLKNCGTFSYTVDAPSGDCGTGSGRPSQTVTVACSDTPATPGWSVTVTYQDVDDTTKTAPLVPVTGDPPN